MTGNGRCCRCDVVQPRIAVAAVNKYQFARTVTKEGRCVCTCEEEREREREHVEARRVEQPNASLYAIARSNHPNEVADFRNLLSNGTRFTGLHCAKSRETRTKKKKGGKEEKEESEDNSERERREGNENAFSDSAPFSCIPPSPPSFCSFFPSFPVK